MSADRSDDPRFARLVALDIPVLRASAAAIAAWAARPDEVDAHRLADIALDDPLLAIRVLAGVAARFGDRLRTPVETVTGALLLTGIDAFFRACEGVAALEDVLAHDPRALAAAQAIVERSYRAARIAAAFAIHRQDEDVEEVQLAALLHDFPDLLLCLLPADGGAAAEVPAEVAAEAAGPEMCLGEALMQAWRLPELLRQLAYERPPAVPGARAVALAVRLARHLAAGWQVPEVAADLAEAAGFLNVNARVATSLVRDALG
jgi:HD-like signal output (HDOD) protein